MAKEPQLHVDMAHARQDDGINVIFDHNSPASSRSRSPSSPRSIVGSSNSSAHKKVVHKRRHRSSSSSSSSSSSRARSRSYPRCRRPSSRCRCSDHHRYGRSYYRRSPSRHHRAHSSSSSRSPSDKSSRRRHYRSHRRSTSRSQSKSLTQWSKYRRSGKQHRHKVSSPRSHRSRSRSRSSDRSSSLTMQDKQEILVAAEDNLEKCLEVENLELPESVEPILSESRESSPSPDAWVRVRPSPEKTAQQSDDQVSDDDDDDSCLQLSPKRGLISFSINNSVAKPTFNVATGAKVTSGVDTYEGRRPYGHWVPVKSSRKRTSAKR